MAGSQALPSLPLPDPAYRAEGRILCVCACSPVVPLIMLQAHVLPLESCDPLSWCLAASALGAPSHRCPFDAPRMPLPQSTPTPDETALPIKSLRDGLHTAAETRSAYVLRPWHPSLRCGITPPLTHLNASFIPLQWPCCPTATVSLFNIVMQLPVACFMGGNLPVWVASPGPM
eukprot:GGOE01005891.1.p2 GENE.GGOE01005891.1~~GGOE01005891.1.p2  ORF type:complete len:174 (+),score=4.58 GGOE01005891.1:485-1006(+)